MNMDLSPLDGWFLTSFAESMANSPAELKCRFASNSMPQGYGRNCAFSANRAERWPGV
jgi:hypothetical protein